MVGSSVKVSADHGSRVVDFCRFSKDSAWIVKSGKRFSNQQEAMGVAASVYISACHLAVIAHTKYTSGCSLGIFHQFEGRICQHNTGATTAKISDRVAANDFAIVVRVVYLRIRAAGNV